MEVQRESVKDGLERKVNRHGQPYDTYDLGPHPS